MRKIKHILEIFYSKMDRNGNMEWAMRYTQANTGKTAKLKVQGGEGNCRSVILELNGGDWGTIIMPPLNICRFVNSTD